MKLEDCKVGLLVKVLSKSVCNGKKGDFPSLDRGWGYISLISSFYGSPTVFLRETLEGNPESGAYSPNELEPYEPEETEYRQLKDITPKAIYDKQFELCGGVGGCFMQEFIQFVLTFELEYEDGLSFSGLTWEFENRPTWEKWLIQHGFIEKVVKPEEVTYEQGDELVNDEGEKAILAQVDSGRMSIIVLEGFDKGNRWSCSSVVGRVSEVTAKEFKEMQGTAGTWRKDK